MSFAWELARFWSDFRLSADLSDLVEAFEMAVLILESLTAERTDGVPEPPDVLRRMLFGA
jgi:hypothetical protein